MPKKTSKLSQNDSATFFEQSQRKRTQNFYTRFAKKASKMFKAKNEFTNEKYKIALEFLDWDLEPKDVNAAPMLGLMVGLGVVIPIAFILLYLTFITSMFPQAYFYYAAPVLLLVPFFLMNYFQTYILGAAKTETMKAVTFIPEIVNYMAMSMKLTPNLEKAVRFAAEHGRGKIADDLQKAIWSTDIGESASIEDALDNLAYTWGKYSEEFKHALMVIRGSVIEADDAKRAILLDKAMKDVLESMKDSMDKYSIQMRQPSIYLYYVGVLLPLMLIIMLPIGSVMAKLPFAQTWIMVLLYNIFIPIGTVFFAVTILKKRPPIYVPPSIPDNYPGLPKKGYIKIGKTNYPAVIIAIIIGVIIFALGWFVVDPIMNPAPNPIIEPEAFKAYFHYWGIAGALIGLSVAIGVYLYGLSYAKRRAQLDLIKMENEFQDSIYILASRLGENRPFEEALTYASDFLEDTHIGGLYKKTSENVQTLGMTVDMAFFDPVYGSLRDVPSDLIRGAMRIVVDSVNLGVEQGARALISLSMQLRDSQKIKEKIASLLEEITSMMKSIAFMVGPLVLGVTTALQDIVIGALRNVGATSGAASGGSNNLAGVGTSSLPMASLGDTKMLDMIPDKLTFLLIMAIYVIEVTVLLTYFTSKIEEGDNDLAVKMNIATSLPIALTLFFLSAWFSSGMSGA